jgi:hypothetical protein
MYLTIKKTIEQEDVYFVTSTKLTSAKIKKGLESGDLNMIQLEAIEPVLWVVNKDGRRIAMLEKDGGSGPDIHTEISISDYQRIKI